MRSVKVNTVLNAFRMLLTVLIPLITFPYTSRVFLTAGNGQLNFTNSIVQIYVLIASLGIYTYGVKEGSKVRDKKESFSQFATELFLINIISCALAYLFFFLMLNLCNFSEVHVKLLAINSLSIFFSALGMDWVFGVYEDYLLITIRQIIMQLFIILSMFVFVQSQEDICLWAFLLMLSGVGANIFNLFNAKRYVVFKLVRWSSLSIKKHIKPILYLFFTQLASKVYSYVDTVLLGILTSDHYVGLYSAGVKVNIILITFFTAMTPVYVPRIIKYLESNNIEGFYAFIKKILTLMLAVGLPAVIGIELLSKEIITLLAGNAFLDAFITIRILTPIILITTIANVLYYNILVPFGREQCVLKCTVISAIINFILSFILVPIYQHNGAAIGSVLSEVLAIIIALGECRILGISLKNMIPSIRNYCLGCILICFAVELIKCLNLGLMLTIFLSMFISVFVYGMVLIIKRDILVEEVISAVRDRTRIKI